MAKNEAKAQLKATQVLDKKVLILGEAGSGKTKLAAQLLQELMMLANPAEISVIDLAPQRVGEIGGKLTQYVNMTSGVKYSSPENVYTPRLTGTSPKQVLHSAELNRKNMEPLFAKFTREVTEILVVNDVTLYLHLGELETVLDCVRLTKTFLATAYYGSKLAEDSGTGISLKEKRLTDELAAFMDLIVRIN